jgi:hypothetical protein
MVNRTHSEKYGKSTLRWQIDKAGGFSGVVVADRKTSAVFHDEDEQRLLARLRNEAGKLHPHYIGMQGAIDRFLEFMPNGFEGDHSDQSESSYKRAAHRLLNATVPLEQARNADEKDAERVRAAPVWINLLSPYESMHLKEALEGPSGDAFLQGAASFANGEFDAGAARMESAMKAHGRLTWPTATYFPYLWNPEKHMFLKPVVTCDFAERIGHPFQHEYEAGVSSGVYESLLDLANFTLNEIRPLGARDFIDVQSFIWVVGAYSDEAKPAPGEIP